MWLIRNGPYLAASPQAILAGRTIYISPVICSLFRRIATSHNLAGMGDADPTGKRG